MMLEFKKFQMDIDKFQKFVFEMDDVIEDFLSEVVRSGYKFDYSLASLDDVELYIDGCVGEQRGGRLFNRCSRYVGEVFRRNLGGAWDICTSDSKDINFLLPVITGFSDFDLDFSPFMVVDNYFVSRRSGLLRGAVEANIEFSKFIE